MNLEKNETRCPHFAGPKGFAPIEMSTKPNHQDEASTPSPPTGKTMGRPRKADGPKVPYPQIDRLLVFGELVDLGDGKEPTVEFPTYRQLARRFGVSHSIIADFAKKRNCMRRREEVQARVEAKTDQKLIELRSTAIAVGKDDALRIIDSYLSGFEKAVAEGRVRFDSPSDFNMMLRLKQFIQGGADSRQEVHVALTLEDLQARHRQMLQSVGTTSAAERGEIERLSNALAESDHQDGADPSHLALAQAPAEVNGDFLDGHFLDGHFLDGESRDVDHDDADDANGESDA